jgi:hypothetical protein
MERVVTVNASRANTDAGGEFGAGYVRDAGDGFGDDFDIETTGSLTSSAASGSQGPCLYFGPRGERCGRPALQGGFCSRHQPGGGLRSGKRPAKLVAAVLAALGLLWPLLGDIVREVFRWIHSH